MNHSNLRLVIDYRGNVHPYAALHRLKFFAQAARVNLVLIPQRRPYVTVYAITKG